MAKLNIVKPTFLIDKKICQANIGNMAEKARRNNLRFRPHFKTHQSAEIGNWFREFEVDAITVSSVSMAKYFAANGWKDITIAFPVNVLEISDINHLAKSINLNLLVENTPALSVLQQLISEKSGIYIEIDTGYGRSGVETNRVNQIDEMLGMLKHDKYLKFKGFLTHNGLTYAADGLDNIHTRHADSLMKLRSLKDFYINNWPEIEISMGDTPACSVCNNFSGVDEIRPGNFVFYDLMQEQIRACTRAQIAALVACPVVSRHFSRNEIVLYGGAVHLSKEFIINNMNKRSYGAVVSCSYEVDSPCSTKTYMSSLSQEHGIIKADFEDLKLFGIGSLANIIPVHSCLAADLAGYYLTTEGEIIEKMTRFPY